AYGISSIRPNVIDYYLEHSDIETLMSQFNLIDNRPEALLDDVHAKKVKVLARGPVFKGLLTAKSNQALDSKFADGIFDYSYQELCKSIRSSKEHDHYSTSRIFNYRASNDAFRQIIVGASRVEQLDENIKNDELSKEISLEKLKTRRERLKNLEYTQHLQ